MIVNQKESSQGYLEEITVSAETKVTPGDVIIGTLTGLDHQGKALVDFPGNIQNTAITAISTQVINQQHVGRQVALLFADNDLTKPIIVGLIHNPLQDILDNFELPEASSSSVQDTDSETNNNEVVAVPDKIDDMLLDGERVVLEAKKEIVLKCGESSITLTESGKILIKGKYLLNRSSGVYRIVGGSVQIN